MRNKLNFCICICIVSAFLKIIYNTIKGPHWYAVQVSDTTMMTIAAFLPGQKTYCNMRETDVCRWANDLHIKTNYLFKCMLRSLYNCLK